MAHPPELTFIQARFAVARSSFNERLAEANLARNAALKKWFSDPAHRQNLQALPSELIPSLIIGSAESYCRAWLSGRVQRNPGLLRQQLADAAWRAVGRED